MAKIEINIPDQYITRVLKSFVWLSKQTEININGDFKTTNFIIDKKINKDSNIIFAKKFIKQLLLGVVKTHEINVDYERYKIEVSNIKQLNVNIPEDIIN